jgi:4-amino-4-deoxy-L-arabinose transferase-like glycosyltransferase
MDSILVGLAALCVNLLSLAVLPARWSKSESIDYPSYYAPLARDLLDGRGWSAPRGRDPLSYPPGYTAIVAGILGLSRATGISEMGAHRAFNIFSAVVAALLILATGKEAFGRKVALYAALIWTTYPLPVWLAKQPNTELPFLVVFFGIVYLVLRSIVSRRPGSGLALAVGALIGAASLIRPFALALSAPVIFILCGSRNPWPARARLLLAGSLLLGNLVVVAPWELWVYSRIGRIIPLCTNGPNSIVDGLTIDVGPDAPPELLPVPDDVRLLIQKLDDRHQDLRSVGAIAHFLTQSFLSEPLAVLKLVGLKVIRALYATDSQRREAYVAAIQVPYYLLALLGAAIAWRLQGNGRRFLRITLPLLGYFWAMSVVVLSIVRYMIPVMGFLIILAGLAVSTIWDRFQRRAASRSGSILP